MHPDEFNVLGTPAVGGLFFETDGGASFRVRAEVEAVSYDPFAVTEVKFRFLNKPEYRLPQPKEPPGVGSIYKNDKGRRFVRIGWNSGPSGFHWMNLDTARLHTWDEVTGRVEAKGKP